MEKEIFKKMGPPGTKKSSAEKHKLEPLSWSLFFEEEHFMKLDKTGDTFHILSSPSLRSSSNPVAFVFLHGAGHTSLSWALTAKLLKDSDDVQVYAYDCRGHGQTQTTNDEDLSAETLTNDCIALVNELFKDSSSKVVLVGHSMGGAIAARAAASSQIKNLAGVGVVDVVEGSALAALPSMHSILERRPKSFPSLSKAIEWSISSEMLKNLESAKVSVPPQLVEHEGKYVWRTALEKTEVFWKGWFEGLSKTFLSAKVAKLLLLAGTDRLDVDLTVAQMQGKYQLTLLPAVGHTIQEDNPTMTAKTLLDFKQRNFREIKRFPIGQT
eukprot:TRINITY_DN4019_c0_g1_i1.p1 TRINITY_DN4019_c0_g1~~TRINITY_DN4019_c0_g1_i1.p1  ORF type:complete len:333 (-),score=58.35 TRINITY_DN4019_c0_g1_i1:105-1082(-)